jgi:hypothetical protein
MKLMTTTEWASKYFTANSRPAESTLARWMRQGRIPSRKVGGTRYVDEHAWLADKDELVQRVLDGE